MLRQRALQLLKRFHDCAAAEYATSVLLPPSILRSLSGHGQHQQPAQHPPGGRSGVLLRCSTLASIADLRQRRLL